LLIFRRNHLQIGARAYMLAPACTGRLQRVLVLGASFFAPPLCMRERLRLHQLNASVVQL